MLCEGALLTKSGYCRAVLQVIVCNLCILPIISILRLAIIEQDIPVLLNSIPVIILFIIVYFATYMHLIGRINRDVVIEEYNIEFYPQDPSYYITISISVFVVLACCLMIINYVLLSYAVQEWWFNID